MPDPSTDPAGPPPTSDAEALWAAARNRLRGALPRSTFELWLEPLRPVGRRGGTLALDAPPGIRAWVERRYAGLIFDTVAAVDSEIDAVVFEGCGPGTASIVDAPCDAPLNPHYTFDRFVIGEGNQLAHHAALAVAEAPAEAYNPLFLHGPPGLGKTHLLVAIANYLAVNAPDLTVRYTTAECFTNEFVRALQSAGAEAFKSRYRDLDVLLIDDVQFLEGKQHTEEEFFHTFNALHEAGSQIVLSADRLPGELAALAGRLRDRFEWGLTVPVAAPDLPTRLTVLSRLVNEAGVEISDENALSELARRINANLRQLHGALTRVLAHASLRARPLSSELIAEVLPAVTPREPATCGAEEIQRTVAESFGLSRRDLVGPNRTAAPVRARQVAILLTRELTDLSLPQIGRLYGGRDHSTVLNAIRRIEAEADADDSLRRKLDDLRTALHN